MPNNKEVLVELKKIADMLKIPLKDLLFGNDENIVVLKNNAKHDNIKKIMKDDRITMSSVFENGHMRTIVDVPDNYVSEKPIHFCFILDTKGTNQVVQPTWNIGKNAKVKIFAYCFGVEYEVIHGDAKIYNIGEGSSLEVYEFNYNGEKSYMKVGNTFKAYLQDNAYFKNYYVSTVGHLGHGTTIGDVYLKGENSKAEFMTKNKILDGDISDLKITFYLEGKDTIGLISSKSVTHKGGTNHFQAKLVGNGDNAKGHIDCSEISLGKCEIITIPQLEVLNPTARFTHEASVGTVEKKAIENLMIKGFTKDEAIEFLVKGILD